MFAVNPEDNYNCSTSGEGELYLLIDDFHGQEVVFLIEASVVQ